MEAILRVRESGNLDYIQILRKPGGSLRDSYLEEGFILEKSFGVGQKREWVNPRILLANTAMDSDKIKIHSTRVRVLWIFILSLSAWTASRRWRRSRRRRRRR